MVTERAMGWLLAGSTEAPSLGIWSPGSSKMRIYSRGSMAAAAADGGAIREPAHLFNFLSPLRLNFGFLSW